MKIAIAIIAIAFSSAAMADYIPCKAKDFRTLSAALKSKKLDKSAETMALIPAVQGLLAQETIGVKCEQYIDLIPRMTIPGSKTSEYRVSDASASYDVKITTNRVEADNKLTIKRTR